MSDAKITVIATVSPRIGPLEVADGVIVVAPESAMRPPSELLETITAMRAHYTTEGCSCDRCGRRWMEIPPAGDKYVRWVQGCYVAAECSRCAPR